jgi:hypothetical protein
LDCVESAFVDYNVDTLVSCYGHLYTLYNTILLHHGDNDFKEPHGNVRHNMRVGNDLRNVTVGADLVEDLRELVNEYFEDELPPI